MKKLYKLALMVAAGAGVMHLLSGAWLYILGTSVVVAGSAYALSKHKS